MGGQPDDAATIDEDLQDPFDRQAVVRPEVVTTRLVDALTPRALVTQIAPSGVSAIEVAIGLGSPASVE